MNLKSLSHAMGISRTRQSRGGAFAGASAGYGAGASAALGGKVDEYGGAGGLGSEAHAGGISTKTVKLSQTPQQPVAVIDQRSSFDDETYEEAPPVVQQVPAKVDQRLNDEADFNSDNFENDDVTEKTKVKSIVAVEQTPVEMVVQAPKVAPEAPVQVPIQSGGATTYTATKQFRANPTFFADIFNIPISTLNAVSQFLSNGAASGSVAVTKTKTVEHIH
ncbi:CLUMA_CG015187, isoform D [Clunio marinus]|uniref:CLUMA_CG015187, isoform D n=1 Tax=Clunio marinus TaxID=568069 RepID=A0A1J1IQG2_9DIPT|nr:CLUMA_CG015187, isoform D [Clunio marinus]